MSGFKKYLEQVRQSQISEGSTDTFQIGEFMYGVKEIDFKKKKPFTLFSTNGGKTMNVTAEELKKHKNL